MLPFVDDMMQALQIQIDAFWYNILLLVAVRHNGRTKWAVGKTYAVQPGRNLPQVARIRVTGIRRQKVTDIIAADAVAEGYDTREQFLAAWVRIHGAGAADADTWAIAFTLVEASPKS